MKRREFLAGGAATCVVGPRALAAAAAPGVLSGAASGAARAFEIGAAKAAVAIVGAPHPDTDVWCYNGRVPGPELRVRQGDTVRVAVRNGLDESTTVHWHGVRVPNAMDGVPDLTQKPIEPGATFDYEFVARDAGTFWYHPHSRSYEQVDRGLHGVLVVEEPTPPAVDRDVAWVLDDWRLGRDASITDDFISFFDTTHAGRIGNTVTLNGVLAEAFEVRAGERLRLRLVNVANARTFGLQFTGHRPWIVAYDGHPVAPHEPIGGVVVVGSSQRVDVVLDATGEPGARHGVRDVYYPRQAYRLLDLAYRDEAPLRSAARGAPLELRANPLPEPQLERAHVQQVRLSGGMMSMNWPDDPWHERLARRFRRMFGAREADPAWAMNGISVTADHGHAPIVTVKRGTTVVLDLVNDTMWPHPMHLHGHAFRVLTRNGNANRLREWRDTVLLESQESARIAFVADNPGNWMLHCHVLEHQAAGMMATVRVE